MRRVFLILFLIITAEMSASTIIVNSIFDNEVIPGSSEAVGAVEDGLMDVFFESGFIMFSIFNSTDHMVTGAKDARYMISIEPLAENYSVSFKLQATINGMEIDSGIVNLSEISPDPAAGDTALYYLLGEKVAKKLIEFF